MSKFPAPLAMKGQAASSRLECLREAVLADPEMEVAVADLVDWLADWRAERPDAADKVRGVLADLGSVVGPRTSVRGRLALQIMEACLTPEKELVSA